MILLIRATTPSSDKSTANAQDKTAMAIIKKTVSMSNAYAVFIMTLNMIPTPITLLRYLIEMLVSTRNTQISKETAFLFHNYPPSQNDSVKYYTDLCVKELFKNS